MDSQDSTDLTFSGFVLSLATTAALHFGDIEDPSTGRKKEPDLTAAAGIISVIEMLQKKTRGNLIPEEERLIDDLLYELRLRYVQAQEGEKRIIEP
jgi:hypothetical protein